jgi:hypothetical protein
MNENCSAYVLRDSLDGSFFEYPDLIESVMHLSLCRRHGHCVIMSLCDPTLSSIP